MGCKRFREAPKMTQESPQENLAERGSDHKVRSSATPERDSLRVLRSSILLQTSTSKYGYTSKRHSVAQQTCKNSLAQSKCVDVTYRDFSFPAIQLWRGKTHPFTNRSQATEAFRYARHQDSAFRECQSEWSRYFGLTRLSS